MFKRIQDVLHSIDVYKERHGVLATIRRWVEVPADFMQNKLLDIALMIAGDDLLEKDYLEDRGVLREMRTQKGLKIGIMKTGGLGDALIATAMVTALKKKWPDAHIYLFVRSANQRQFLSRDKNIEKIMVVSERVNRTSHLHDKAAKDLTNRHLDICFLHRYVVKAYFRKGVMPDLNRRLDELFEMHNLNFFRFPHLNNSLTVFRKNEYELSSACTDLAIEPSGLSLNLIDDDYKILEGLPKVFFTVHNGADSEFDSPLRGKNNIQTKNWFADRWAEVSRFVKSSGYEVVQLGLGSDEYIPGTIDLRGKTTLTSVGAVLKKAILHLDTEGGLVHFAKAVGTRSLVLFGPTSLEFYGYKDNINIRSDVCRDCWWSEREWPYRCSAGHAVAVCMDSISVEMVTNALEDFLRERGKGLSGNVTREVH